MFKRFGIPTLALAAALAATVPSVSLARDRDDYRGGERHEVYRSHDDRRGNRDRDRDWDRDWDRDRDRGRTNRNLGFGFYNTPAPVRVAPAPVSNGYYDPYGAGRPYNSYPAPYGPYRY